MKKLTLLFACLALAACAFAQTGAVRKSTATATQDDLTEDLNLPSGKTFLIKAGATMEFQEGAIVTGLPAGSADGRVLFGNGVPSGGTGANGDVYHRLDSPFGVYAKAAGSWTLQTTYVPASRTINGDPLSADVTLDKSDVGLGNVDNTSDANKPISNATQTALDNKSGTGHTHVAANITDSTNVGRAVLTVTNPGAVRYLRINADNTVTLLDAAGLLAAIGADNASNITSGTLAEDRIHADIARDSEVNAKVVNGINNGATTTAPSEDAVFDALALKAAATHAAAPGSDDTFTGDTITGLNNTGGVTQWDVVYLNGSSQWVLADANGTGTYPAAGLATSTVATGEGTTVLVRGAVRNDAWNWTPGGRIYLSTTPGGLTQTAPATSGDKVQDVGFALSADVAWLVFDGVYVEVD